MARLFLRNPADAERQLKRILDRKSKQMLADFRKYLNDLKDILGERFAQSEEFNRMKGSLKGEFGFTDQEIVELDGIINTIKNDRDVTRVSVGPDRVMLEWGDFRVLKDHPNAKHPLTRLNPKTGLFEIIQIVSWVDWLENGLSITGYTFEEKGGRFSRSKEGQMTESSGLFRLPRTKIFEKIANSIDEKEVRAGIAVILEKKVT